jgi:hypothetical protein
LDGDGGRGQVQLAFVALLQAVLTFKKKPETKVKGILKL